MKSLFVWRSILIALSLFLAIGTTTIVAPKVFATSDFTVSNVTFDPSTGLLEFDYTGSSISNVNRITDSTHTSTYWQPTYNTSCTTSHCRAGMSPRATSDSGVTSVVFESGNLLYSQTLSYPLPLPTSYTSQTPLGGAGWVPAESQAWTYATSTTITVPAGATSKYSIGDKIRLKQGGSYKYFYIVGVASTTLTITGGSDYSLANSTITDNYYSKVSTPQDFPQWFNYSPTYTGFSSSPSGGVNRFRIDGNTCFIFRRAGTAGTSNSIQFFISAPVQSASGPADYWTGGLASVSDNSSNQANPGRVYIQASTSTLTVEKAFNSVDWATSGTKNAEFQFSYEIN